MMHSQIVPYKFRPQSAWVLALAIILIAVTLRVFNINQYPMGTDEGRHLLRIYDIVDGNIFEGLEQNKWFYGYLVAQFNATGLEGRWLARYINVLWAAVTVATCVSLGRMLHSWRAGLLAGLLYAVATMGIFHERQSLHDPQMTATAMVAFLFMIRLARFRYSMARMVAYTVIMTAFLLLSRLTKPAMVGFLVLPFVTLVILRLLPDGRIPSWEQMRSRVDASVLRSAALQLGGVLAVVGVAFWVYQVAAAQGVLPRSTHSVTPSNTIIAAGLLPQQFLIRILTDLKSILFIHLTYWSVGFVLAVLLGVIWMIASREHRSVLLLLAIPALVYLVIPVLADRPASTGRLYPRYLLINGPALAVFASVGLLITYQRYLSNRSKLQALITALVVLPTLAIGMLWSFDPDLLRSRLPITELPYLEQIPWDGKSPTARDTAVTLHADWVSNPNYNNAEPYTAMVTFGEMEYMAYLGRRMGQVIVLNPADPTALPFWVARSERVYLIEDEEGYRLPTNYREQDLTLLYFGKEFEQDRQWLWRVDRLNGDPADAVYTHRAAAPASMVEDYQALLPQTSSDLLYTFPVNHADVARTLTDTPVQPLALRHWPLQAETLRSNLLEMGTDGERVGVILVDEASTDAQRALQLALHSSNLYPYIDLYSGVLHYIGFVTGPANPTLTDIEATYEGTIHLDSVSILDEEAVSGQVVRIAYLWTTEKPIEDNFAVFTHIFDSNGNPVALYDSQPGRGLFPTSSWESGELIIDRFAIPLPADLVPGTYTVWTGLYNPAIDVRLQVTDGNAENNAVLIGNIEVR